MRRYAQQGRYDESEKLLHELLKENPELSEINTSLALLLAERGRYEESREFFLKASELMPEQTRIIYNLGLLENTLGNTDAAEGYLLRAVMQEPQSFDYLYAVATFYLEHGQKARALTYARQLAEKFPGEPAGKQLVDAANK